ncbi:sensitivity to red-light reduced protein [Podila minutissima]|uniref:Sensitivity to red-light reduced protein n=1 Tax=Podila minutissima TaxID=64525 RepID=A0A9P5SL21_9FUNG|nr:sensitivity to red-light reduced protein [Podila minutissima]
MSTSTLSEALQNMSLATPISTSSSALSSPNSPDSAMFVTPPSSPSSPISSTDSINGDLLSGLSLKLRVMIVDDNSVNLDFLSKVLETHFKNEVILTHKVASGVEALEQLAQEAVDLILMDIDMPVLTGVQTTEAIRTGEEHAILKSNRTIPIIAVTTSDSEEQQELYRQSGMAGCVSKPIKIPVLRAVIQDALKPTG